MVAFIISDPYSNVVIRYCELVAKQFIVDLWLTLVYFLGFVGDERFVLISVFFPSNFMG